ncbi:hypothetical protein D3C81_2008030 [compost metagenome]
MFLKLAVEPFDEIYRNLIRAVIVISVSRIFAFNYIVDSKTVLIPDWPNLCIFNGTERVGYDRKTRNPGCHGPHRFLIMKRHLDTFITIFIMHVVNYI